MTITFIILSTLLFALSVGLYIALQSQRNRIKEVEGELTQSQQQEREATTRVVALETQIEVNRERDKEREQEQQRQQKEQVEQQKERERQMSDHFKSLATEIFSDQSRQFKQSNKESIDLLLKPFKDNISSFRERVETIYNSETEQRGALKSELRQLMELNTRITAETHNLTSALKGNSKVQGDWGEMILETILESSNLTKGTHYTTQHNFKGEEGQNLRPDVVLNLPGGKRIIIDSKTSLTAFVNYTAAEPLEEQRAHMASHILSVKRHIKELSSKEYWKMVGSPDFVIMFIPSEPAFLAALQADSSLWSDAYDNRVVISSPTNLFALLKLVDDLWRRDAQDRNTQKIVAQGAKLYDQLIRFSESLEGVGVALNTARSKYDDAYKRFTEGNNNLVRVGRGLQELGVPTKRDFSPKTLEASDLDQTSDSSSKLDSAE